VLISKTNLGDVPCFLHRDFNVIPFSEIKINCSNFSTNRKARILHKLYKQDLRNFIVLITVCYLVS